MRNYTWDSTEELLSLKGNYIPLESKNDVEEEEDDEATQKKKEEKKAQKYQKILLLCTVLAVLFGLVGGLLIESFEIDEQLLDWIHLPGTLYLRLLKCIIVPLMATAIAGAFGSFATINDGKVGWYAVAWYISTTVLAGSLALVWVAVYQPWRSFSANHLPIPPSVASLSSVKTLLFQLFPDNLFRAVLDMNMLGVLVFSALFGLVTPSVGKERSAPLLLNITSIKMVLEKMMRVIIWVSPLGILSQIAYQVGKSGDFLGVVNGMGLLIATRFTALAVHALIILPTIYVCITKRNPFKVLLRVTPVWLSAFGTSSAAATAPITVRNLEETLQIPTTIAKFICATGTSTNTDGACIVYTITAVCMAKVVGMEMYFGNLLAVILTSTLVSLGAAAIPSGLLTNHIIVMSAIELPLDVVIPILSPILCITWLEDRIITMTNIESDILAASAIHHIVNE